MALETLRGVEEIGGFKVIEMDSLRDKYPEMFREDGSMKYEIFEREIRPNNFIYVRHDKNSVAFTIQNGPIKEAGLNGCQVDTLIHTARLMIDNLNKKLPSHYNEKALAHLDEAIRLLEARKEDREARGVEGTSND
jgi:hypothetical protein